MKKTILIFTFIFFYSQNIMSQDTFFIGEKTYPCTENFEIGESPFHKFKILFIKNGESGMVAVTIRDSYRIKNKLIIYLEDNTIITCVDRNKFDVVNNETTTIYYLTKEEIYKLKNTNISSIRYSAGGIDTKHVKHLGSPDNYRVQNTREVKVTYPYFSTYYEKVDFPAIIRELFN